MSSLSSAMAAKQVGENNHFEYKWSVNGFETLFSQLYFQLVRTKDFSRIKDLEYNFNTLLTNAHGNIDNLLLLAKLTLHTRDCVGKGERDLFYMLRIKLRLLNTVKKMVSVRQVFLILLFNL